MPKQEAVAVDVKGVQLIEAPRTRPVMLGDITGVQIVVLLRHPH